MAAATAPGVRQALAALVASADSAVVMRQHRRSTASRPAAPDSGLEAALPQRRAMPRAAGRFSAYPSSCRSLADLVVEVEPGSAARRTAPAAAVAAAAERCSWPPTVRWPFRTSTSAPTVAPVEALATAVAVRR